MKMTIFIGLCLVLFQSCDNRDPFITPQFNECLQSYTGPLDVLWSAPIHQDTLFGNSIHPVIYDDHILYSRLWLNEPNVIYSLSPETGERQWEWSELPYVGEVIQFNNPTQSFDDKFYFNYRNHKILIDIDNPSTEWSSFQNFSSTRVSAGSDYLYYLQSYDENDNSILISSEIFRTKKNAPVNWESVYFEQGSLNNRLIFEVPAEWINPQGDTLLIFSKGRVEMPATSNLLAYNMTQRKMEWEIEDLADVAYTTYHIPIIRGNLAYITNARTISCVDLTTGIELWETVDLDTGFSRCAPVLSEDKIFVNGDDGRVRGIHLNDGSIAWSKNDSNNNPINMGYYKGGLYYCTDSGLGQYLYGLEADTGEVFYREVSPNQDCKSNANFSYGLSIDQESGRLYTQDGYFALCLQLTSR